MGTFSERRTRPGEFTEYAGLLLSSWFDFPAALTRFTAYLCREQQRQCSASVLLIKAET